jgi:hypothetical protein
MNANDMVSSTISTRCVFRCIELSTVAFATQQLRAMLRHVHAIMGMHGCISHTLIISMQEGGWDSANLTEQGYNADAEIMLFASNRGEVWEIFHNPLYQEQLAQWGLTTETAWQCAFAFLFRPTPKVAKLFSKEVGALRNHRPLRIGVNIRVGDQSEVTGGPVGNVFRNRYALLCTAPRTARSIFAMRTML